MNGSRIILLCLVAGSFFGTPSSGIAQFDGPAVSGTVNSSQPSTQFNYGYSDPYLFPPPPADCNAPGPILVQPYGPLVAPGPSPDMVPMMPVPGCDSPRPGPLPGPVFVPPPPVGPPAEAGSPANPLAGIAPGGMISPQFGLPPGPDAVPGLGNPILVPVGDDQFAWEQIADVVSDYFTIAREQQARRSGEVWSEGRIDTAYQGGATWLEPHRHDSVGSFNRWESTFQSIRRIATVRVIPDSGGYLVEVVVNKELEDLPRPEHATAGAATFRTDGSLPTARADRVSRTFSSPRWIPLGRDAALETRMLADIQARLAGPPFAAPPGAVRQ